jgi:hypothetical protein
MLPTNTLITYFIKPDSLACIMSVGVASVMLNLLAPYSILKRMFCPKCVDIFANAPLYSIRSFGVRFSFLAWHWILCRWLLMISGQECIGLLSCLKGVIHNLGTLPLQFLPPYRNTKLSPFLPSPLTKVRQGTTSLYAISSPWQTCTLKCCSIDHTTGCSTSQRHLW